VSNITQIGKKEVRPKFNRGRLTVSFIKQKNTVEPSQADQQKMVKLAMKPLH
jgi:hypothetical protein